MSNIQIPRNHDRMLRVGITAWTIIGSMLVAAGVFWALGRISGALTPFLMAGVVVLLLRGPVRRLEKRGVPRSFAVLICYVVGFAVFSVLGAFVFPRLGAQVVQFVDDFPGYYNKARDLWLQTQGRFSAVAIPDWAQQALDQIGSTITAQFGNWSRSAASGVVSAGSATFSFAFNIVFALVIAFWMLKDLNAMRGEFFSLLGEKRRAEGDMILTNVLRVLGGYLKGQALVSLITGLLTAIGLAVLGVPYALVLGLITGVLNIVPYVGALTGGLISAIVAAFIGPWVALGSIAVTFAAQQVTDLFVTPRVMSEQVDLHPLLVIFSLLVGGSLFGFWGLIVAIPAAAILKGLFVYYYEKHTRRILSSEQGALFRKKKISDEDQIASAEDVSATTNEPSAEERD